MKQQFSEVGRIKKVNTYFLNEVVPEPVVWMSSGCLTGVADLRLRGGEYSRRWRLMTLPGQLLSLGSFWEMSNWCTYFAEMKLKGLGEWHPSPPSFISFLL